MRLFTKAAALAVLATIIGLGLATPAHADAGTSVPPLPVGPFSGQQLKFYCLMKGGIYDEGIDGTYVCILPAGGTIVCKQDIPYCSLIRTVFVPKTTFSRPAKGTITTLR